MLSTNTQNKQSSEPSLKKWRLFYLPKKCNFFSKEKHRFVLLKRSGKVEQALGTKKPSFDEIYMELAEKLAMRSHCVKAQVGAVLTKDTRIISLGYNGPPAGTHNCDQEWPGVGCPRDSKGSCSLALHAEQNAILYAAKNNFSIDGSTLYVTLSPCIACARVIFSVGIKKVFYKNSYAQFKGISTDEGVDFLRKFGVEVIHHP